MRLTFTSHHNPGGGATSFIFTPNEPLVWQAGQSIKIEVPGPYGPLEHRFTIASAPAEKHVMITTRLGGSPYKNSLAALKPGDTVASYSVDGSFLWREAETPHIFVAAGIGITPYRAILTQRALDGQPLKATLIYNDVIHKEELDALAASHPGLEIRYITGRRINSDDIPQTTGHIYLSGPSAMVDDLSAQLTDRGVAENQLVRDWFTGRLVD